MFERITNSLRVGALSALSLFSSCTDKPAEGIEKKTPETKAEPSLVTETLPAAERPTVPHFSILSRGIPEWASKAVGFEQGPWEYINFECPSTLESSEIRDWHQGLAGTYDRKVIQMLSAEPLIKRSASNTHGADNVTCRFLIVPDCEGRISAERQPAPEIETCIAQKGDTWEIIAAKVGTPYDLLLLYNHIKSTNFVQPKIGQEINLPHLRFVRMSSGDRYSEVVPVFMKLNLTDFESIKVLINSVIEGGDNDLIRNKLSTSFQYLRAGQRSFLMDSISLACQQMLDDAQQNRADTFRPDSLEKVRSFSTAILTAQRLGIQNPFRIEPLLFAELMQQTLAIETKQFKAPVKYLVTIIDPYGDYNNAMQMTALIRGIQQSFPEAAFYYRQADGWQQAMLYGGRASDILKQAPNLRILNGHGHIDSMGFGYSSVDGPYTNFDLKSPEQQRAAELCCRYDNQATINLFGSCSTGLSLVKTFSAHTKGKSIGPAGNAALPEGSYDKKKGSWSFTYASGDGKKVKTIVVDSRKSPIKNPDTQPKTKQANKGGLRMAKYD